MVSYLGMLQQGLLDLSDWAEGRKAAPETTGYDLIDNQIILKEDEKERGGLQPKFTLTVDGGKTFTVKAGEPVIYTAVAESVASAGIFEAIEWSFEGAQTFDDCGGEVTVEEADGVFRATVTKTHCFDKPGTYYSVARVITNCNEGDGYTRLRNLDRVRVDVE